MKDRIYNWAWRRGEKKIKVSKVEILCFLISFLRNREEAKGFSFLKVKVRKEAKQSKKMKINKYTNIQIKSKSYNT
jgi:hypothetical protein